ncbi:MAG: TadE/TadG family type IV pilus assembly protein [Anaerolineales bacterium]
MRRSFAAKSQGLVEFALVLPIVVLIIFGLIETGRLLFIYSSAITSSRGAVRYASATGVNDAGVPRYRDCDGIRNEARRTAFVNVIRDDQIIIQHDSGPGTTAVTYCPPGTSVDNSFTPQRADRVLVTVSTDFVPMVPGLLPFPSFTITASSARTILGSVPVQSPPGSGGGGGGGGGGSSNLSLAKSANPTQYSYVGQVINYTYTLTNTSSTSLTSPYTVSDNKIPSVNCSGAISPLAPGASTTCTATYTITQADLDAGFVTNQATATARAGSNTVTSNQATTTITAAQNPRLSLTKQANPTFGGEGSTITYTYTLTNNGNVTLTAPYVVSDNKISNVSCPNTPNSLAPGASIICTATYTITAADVAVGQVINVATATAKFGANTITSNQASARVLARPLDLQVAANPSSVSQAGQIITYTYTVTNVGGSTVTGLTITDTLVTNITCGTTTLSSGQSTTCTGTYTVTQANLDSGNAITNQSTASATASSGTVSSPTVTTTVLVQRMPALILQKSASPNPATTLGQTVTYTYTLQNAGNVTLTAPYTITDDKISSVDCSGAVSPLLPGQSTTCTATYQVTQVDLDNGSVINTAQAMARDAKDGTTIVSSASVSHTLITYNAPRLNLSITASPNPATAVGQSIQITFTLKNTGNTPLQAPFTISYTIQSTNYILNCSSGVLGLGSSVNCYANYTITSSDASAGQFSINATATASSPLVTSNPASYTVEVTICDVRHSTISTSWNPGRVWMTIYNYGNFTIRVSNITIYWNTQGNNTITNIFLGGLQIWPAGGGSGSVSYSPTSFSITNNNLLGPGSSPTLEFWFSKNYHASGNERIVVQFLEPACPILDSNDPSQLP